MKAMLDLVRRHRAGERAGICSVCSAHPLVIEATLEHARDTGALALIEATSNQVNQDGGYTGMRPAQFRDRVWAMADAANLPRERVLLGGDHLGPNAWQHQSAAEAMTRAGVMISEYVTAGFRKIHLDCSMSCADDPRGLSDEVIAERTATLCVLAEQAADAVGGERPVYVIGSEVPVPGGAQEALHELVPTEPMAVARTLAAHRDAFRRHGLDAALERVIALVVQPGVEFDNEHVVDYQPAKAQRLIQCLTEHPNLVFEAHSTDYQTPAALAALVRDHFAILKVGPGVTFALREALWALDRIRADYQPGTPALRDTVLAVMHGEPSYWRKYYPGEGAALELQLQYSLSDRIRYYWTHPTVSAAVSSLFATIDSKAPPAAVLSQYLPASYAAVRAGLLQPRAADLTRHHVRQVLGDYSRACGQSKS